MTLVEPRLEESAGIMPLGRMSLHIKRPIRPCDHEADYGGYRSLSVFIPPGPLPNVLVGPWWFPTPTSAGRELTFIGLLIGDLFYRFNSEPVPLKAVINRRIGVIELRFDHSLKIGEIDV